MQINWAGLATKTSVTQMQCMFPTKKYLSLGKNTSDHYNSAVLSSLRGMNNCREIYFWALNSTQNINFLQWSVRSMLCMNLKYTSEPSRFCRNSLSVSLLHTRTHTHSLNVRKQSPITIFSTEHSPLSSIKWVQKKSELFMFLPQVEWCDNSMNYTFLVIQLLKSING